jgi:hypothetical protein
MASHISVEVILLVIIVCIAYYMTHRNNVIVVPSERYPSYASHHRLQEAESRLAHPPVSGGDDRYTMAPRPLRQYNGLPQIASRGPPEQYQQMGILDGGDGKLLPLYGRRVAARSDYFNYYTRTDTYNPVAVPVKFNKRDCQDSVGCKEVMSGDEVDISLTGQKGKVTLYGFDGPRYEP